MREEPVEWFSIKYLWTVGIQSWWGFAKHGDKYACNNTGKIESHRFERIGTECFRTFAEAVVAANDAKVRKVRSLKKRLAAVEATTFPATIPAEVSRAE